MCDAGECDNIAGELAEAQGTSAEMAKERDELASGLANLEAEHVNLSDAHTSLKYMTVLISNSTPFSQNCIHSTCTAGNASNEAHKSVM